MKSKEEIAIEFQLKDLDTSLFEGSDKILKVKVEVGSGAYEDLRVGHDDVTLECTMAWNTGSFEYDIPAKELIKILKTKPVDKIRSADLADYDKELIKVQDGDLECRKVNDIEIENEKEIILYGSDDEVDFSYVSKRGFKREIFKPFEGVVRNIERRLGDTDSNFRREYYAKCSKHIIALCCYFKSISCCKTL